jgi:hypothetical protein
VITNGPPASQSHIPSARLFSGRPDPFTGKLVDFNIANSGLPGSFGLSSVCVLLERVYGHPRATPDPELVEGEQAHFETFIALRRLAFAQQK